MFLLLFLLSLFQHLRSAPIIATTIDLDPNDQLLRAPKELVHTFGQRQVIQIVTSCLATIFACTWTAIHPGIPHFGQSRVGFIYQRLNITGYALLYPELILFWALHEGITAEGYAKRYNEKFGQVDKGCPSSTIQLSKTADSATIGQPRMTINFRKAVHEYLRDALRAIRKWCLGPILPPPPQEGNIAPWTTTHGFFLEMGGFVLYEDIGPRHPHTLSGEEFMNLIEAKVIDAPSISEDDIRDRCKGDYLTKGATVIQTTWFVFQCASWWSSNLPVTELEVTTLGFAMLNSITYLLWWDKPQNIGIPIYLNATRSGGRVDEGQSASDSSIHSMVKARQHSDPEGEHRCTSASFSTETCPVGTDTVDDEDSALGLFSHIFPRQSLARKFFMQHPWRAHNNPFFIFLHLHYNLIRALLIHDSYLIKDHPKRFLFGGCIGILFGLVHLLPSLLHGLTLTSRLMWLWRGSAIVMIAIPPLYVALMRVFNPDIFKHSDSDEKACLGSKHGKRAMHTLAIVIMFSVYLKLASRPVIAFLALYSLHQLPAEALQTVSWVLLVPHV